MNKQLIEKYNVAVPRYTSYPPANYFHPFDANEYLQAVEHSNGATDNHISFYIHMPFCKRLCHYCGCNSYPMPGAEKVDAYIEALHQEIDLVAAHIDSHRKISQIHYGGGSPTAMPVGVLKELNAHMLSLFPTIEKPEIAIECHPGYLDNDYWNGLLDAGFNRFSLGIQDFDERVLKAVNRKPSLMEVSEIVDLLHGAGASVNMDFLFGLPYQTAESFVSSIRKALAMHPDRITTFSYGHCPWIFKRQQILDKIGLPSSEEKSKMFQCAEEAIHEAGYISVGMDHFVLPSDELAEALRQHLLHRNFQGYCTRRTTAQVYAFGVTGISQLESAYAQNTKDIDEYIADIKAGRLATAKGYLLSPNERVAREVIETLMCNYHINWDNLGERLHLSVADIRKAIHWDEQQLSMMEHDGIIRMDDHELSMHAQGSPFVRNVAAALDPLMVNTTRKFSKPI